MSALTPASIAARTAVCLVVSYIGYSWMGLIGLVMTSPIWGVMFAKVILETFPALGWQMRRLHYEKWEGKYYKYENTHLRAHFDGDDAWFVADDVLSVLGKQRGSWLDSRFGASEYRLIPGRTETGFTPEAVLKLIDMSEHPEARKFRLWFERAVVFTLERKRQAREVARSP